MIKKIARELSLKWRKQNRYILERKIFPNIKNKKILFVGCAKYTQDYPEKLKDNYLWTLDKDPNMAEFGGKFHVIGDITNASKEFNDKYFDVIFMVGVFGYGLNVLSDCERAMKVLHTILSDKGVLIIQSTKSKRVKPNKLKGFKLFKPTAMFDYPAHYENECSVWDFLVKEGK